MRVKRYYDIIIIKKVDSMHARAPRARVKILTRIFGLPIYVVPALYMYLPCHREEIYREETRGKLCHADIFSLFK